MSTLYSRRAMRQIDRPHQLTWADIERPAAPEPVEVPRTQAFAYLFAFICGFAAGVALVLLAVGA